jgi:septal ring factor EnvC (AmiA/AmiB activator)
MEEMVKLELPKAEAVRLYALIEEMLSAMRKANEEMARDQTEIERLKATTAARLEELRKVA